MDQFPINPFGAMQLMVENGKELVGRSLADPYYATFRFNGNNKSFQIQHDNHWHNVEVDDILSRTFRLPERKPREWSGDGMIVHHTPGGCAILQMPVSIPDGTRVHYTLTELL